ncbi:MAG TPA: VOC family protein, partial [Frankiaceae bacterium]|nr:VOC family protein [Frankiaceae bacterium]
AHCRGDRFDATSPPGCGHAGSSRKDIIIACADVEAVATVWSELLARPVVARIGPYVWLERRDGVGLGFQAVPADGLGSSSIHLDLGAENPAAEQARIEALGGRRVEGYDDGGFLVMADPEGNKFCVLPAEPFEVDDQGRAGYLKPGQGTAEGR